MASGVVVRPFSNGTERSLWMSGNCWDGCVRAVDESDVSKPFRCAIQSALSLAAMTGTIPAPIARRAGFDRAERVAGYFPCGEFSDTRTVAKRRGRRRSPGQIEFTNHHEGDHVQQHIEGNHNTDEDGNPAGGSTVGTGIAIDWQNGPLGRGEDRQEPNGAFVEGVIQAALDRLEHYQTTDFRCRENALAITKLEEALHWCGARTARRESAGTEGTHAGN